MALNTEPLPDDQIARRLATIETRITPRVHPKHIADVRYDVIWLIHQLKLERLARRTGERANG